MRQIVDMSLNIIIMSSLAKCQRMGVRLRPFLARQARLPRPTAYRKCKHENSIQLLISRQAGNRTVSGGGFVSLLASMAMEPRIGQD